MMSALTWDDRFEQIVNERAKGEGRPKNMCEVLDRVENRGIKKGIKEGKKEGIISTLSNLVKKGKLTLADAAQEAQMSVSSFKKAAGLGK